MFNVKEACSCYDLYDKILVCDECDVPILRLFLMNTKWKW